MNIILNKSNLNAFEMQNQDYLVDTMYYNLEAGQAEYRLYSYMSTLFDNVTILDIGTNQGRSAVALSHNPTNHVISYDIEDHIHSRDYNLFTKSNMEFHVKNVVEDITPEFIESKNVQLVMIDICHTGPPEREIMDKLWDSGFRGTVLLDDIWHPESRFRDDMQKMWNELPWQKYDVTSVGHWSGTGLVFMNDTDSLQLVTDDSITVYLDK
jgi:predicted O-methyltransferase YrrM